MSEIRAPGAPPTASPPSRASRRLRRSRTDRILFGVCGGLGRYLDVDPVVLRVLAVALVFAGVGVPAYLVAWLVIPEAEPDVDEGPADAATRHQTATVLGAAMVGLGVLLLARGMMPWFHMGFFWPLVVVAGGVMLVVSARR